MAQLSFKNNEIPHFLDWMEKTFPGTSLTPIKTLFEKVSISGKVLIKSDKFSMELDIKADDG